MMRKERKIWQESAGDTKRNYVDICLSHQVMIRN